MEDMALPKILPPSEDGVFKSLLTHPDAVDILKDLIGCMLDVVVLSAAVCNTELPVDSILEKRERFDVNCITDGGRQVEIEMQAEAMEGDGKKNAHHGMKNRDVYYACKLHSSQSLRGSTYDKTVRTYQVTFCGYTVFEGRPEFLNRFSLRNEKGEELTDVLNLVFVELSKLKEVVKKPVGTMAPLEMWPVFFRYADDGRYETVIEEIAVVRKEIAMANALLKNISRDEDERARFRAREKYQSDWEHSMIVRERKGRAEGEAKGKAEGRVEGEAKGKAEGKAEGRAEVVCNLLKMQMPLEQISEVTGLSVYEI